MTQCSYAASNNRNLHAIFTYAYCMFYEYDHVKYIASSFVSAFTTRDCLKDADVI